MARLLIKIIVELADLVRISCRHVSVRYSICKCGAKAQGDKMAKYGAKSKLLVSVRYLGSTEIYRKLSYIGNFKKLSYL